MSVIVLAIRAVLVSCFVGVLATPARSDNTNPGTNAANPSTNGTNPNTNATNPSTNATNPSGIGAATPVDDFATQYKQFKDTLTTLPKKIEDTSRLVEGNSSGAGAHQQLDALRAIVSEALTQVADNGPVAKLGQTALNYTRRKLTDFQQDTHFTKEQREYLVKEWSATSRLTLAAVEELEAARKELTDLLKVLQSNEDFMGELEALNNAAKTVEVIRDLTIGLREISGRLKVIFVKFRDA